MIDYDAYDIEIDTRAARRERSRREPARAKVRPKHAQVASVADGVEPGDDAAVGFMPTYKSADNDHFEHQWIVSALSGFYDDKLIDDVRRAVKGGKEASVYLCEAHPSTGVDWIAAKIYRPRMFRSLKNDALYREGREILDGSGKTIKARDKRMQRAVHQMTRFGQSLRIGSWIGHEYETLQLLHRAGVDIPKPFAAGENCILMEFIGDDVTAAPALNHVALERDEAQPLFARVLRNVEIMLSQHRIHADLSAYNILYWDGEIRIIDFPQAVDPRVNPHAETLLARDVERVCQYFARFGVKTDAVRLAHDLWSRYMRAEL
jgi:RIO kinase 1